ncbi:MAG: P1 family peptidase [Acidimicrobiia bacterium]|nr:P1 family peptidase [Acidimicrobiia bacterium]MDH5505382.1 P1 family peptidase [Acidimicrobiia bacterium]
MSLTSIAGVRVGHWTHDVAQTGCTVVIPPTPNVAYAEVRGAAPGSRELSLLGAGMSVQQVSAIVLTGGSAFGLAAADGVMAGCEDDGVGHPTPGGVVPIVPAAVIYDLMVGDGSIRPIAANGRAAYEDASDRPVLSGPFGAGAGATVAKWRGPDATRPSGIGSGLMATGGVQVAALSVVNALGDVYRLDGTPLTDGPGMGREPTNPPMLPGPDGILTNTTLVCVITDAVADRTVLSRLAIRAHDAMGAMIAPVHTRFDGDTVFVISTGQAGPAQEELLGEAVFLAVADSISAAVESRG